MKKALIASALLTLTGCTSTQKTTSTKGSPMLSHKEAQIAAQELVRLGSKYDFNSTFTYPEEPPKQLLDIDDAMYTCVNYQADIGIIQETNKLYEQERKKGALHEAQALITIAEMIENRDDYAMEKCGFDRAKHTTVVDNPAWDAWKVEYAKTESRQKEYAARKAKADSDIDALVKPLQAYSKHNHAKLFKPKRELNCVDTALSYYNGDISYIYRGSCWQWLGLPR